MAHREKEAGGRAGRRSVPHTADLRVEAWAPGREECLAQVVRGLVEAFVDLEAAADTAARTRPREAVIRGERDEDLLVELLDEVIYRLDAEGEVPVDLRIEPAPGGLKADFAMAEMAALPQVGAAPKAVTLHGLAFGRGPEGFACSVTLDV
ncbi:archease [Streptomyces sp. 6N223]|uniref:archease n=1 Tax=Streptomyces sp. 6N223 TaxID=3457412 RepID=UPI003FD4938A